MDGKKVGRMIVHVTTTTTGLDDIWFADYVRREFPRFPTPNLSAAEYAHVFVQLKYDLFQECNMVWPQKWAEIDVDHRLQILSPLWQMMDYYVADYNVGRIR